MPPIADFNSGGVRGFLHTPDVASGSGLVLAHGAGGNARAPLMTAVAAEFCRLGVHVLRIDLPYRQARASGPPRPAEAAGDRAGIRAAADRLRGMLKGPIYLAGHSYGGRQCSMLAAEDSSGAAALLLLSYPLHPPGKPEQLRTAHLPLLIMPVFFVHGTKDPFGSIEELRQAIKLIPGRTDLRVCQGEGHGVKATDPRFVTEFLEFAR